MSIRDPHTVPPQSRAAYTIADPVDQWHGHPVYDEDFEAAATFLQAHQDAFRERLYAPYTQRSYTPQGLERERLLADADAIQVDRLRRMWAHWRDHPDWGPLAWDLIRLATLPYEGLEEETGGRPCPPFDPAWRKVLGALTVQGRE